MHCVLQHCSKLVVTVHSCYHEFSESSNQAIMAARNASADALLNWVSKNLSV